ncbi:hypothetical protein NR800_18045 [Corallococcus interemptor]|uniref:hypothetical protein n=1 Tax=Corallococcus TaxID=83461 RepID=UPI001CBF7EA7|nr:hypothetical protein [Corallococcus sp. AS-1-12]MBZ4332987.1 hypothetical protein [Corallococcus sp. AS-1-12]
MTEELLAQATHHEEVLLGFAVVRKAVGRSFDESLLDRFREAVVAFIQENISGMQRDTLRYAIERLEPEQRKALLALEYKTP